MRNTLDFTIDILNSLPDQIAIVANDGVIVHINEAWIEFSEKNGGQQKRNGLGSNYFHLLQTSELHYELNGFQSVQKGLIKEFILQYPCHSNSAQRWFKMFVTRLGDDYLLIRHHDITLELTGKPYEDDVLESMTDSIFSVNKDWEFSFVNPAAYQLLNRAPGSLLNKNIWYEFPEIMSGPLYSNYVETMRSKETKVFESYYLPLEKWFEFRVYPRKKGGISVCFRDIHEKKISHDQLTEFAFIDSLTNLPNRHAINKTLANKLSQSLPCSLLFLDLDGFKFVNDMNGHEVGDKLLQEFSRKLCNHVKQDAFVGRLGGDEFLLIIDEIDPVKIRQFARYVLELFNQPFILEDQFSFHLTASIGISTYPTDKQNLPSLMKAADIALYKAKKQSGSCVVFFEPNMIENGTH